MKNKLPAMQGLRVLATLGIFLFHSGFLINGTFLVTLFFMLSGFMMYYTKFDNISLTTGLRKIKSMYPLHIITFLISFIVGNVFINYSKEFFIKGSILQILLLQSWFNEYTFSFNGLAWYLSITCFLYVISYPIVHILRKINHMKTVLILLLLGIYFINLLFFDTASVILYSNPIYRILDFLLGMLLAKIYIERKCVFIISKANIFELLIIIIFFMQYILNIVIFDAKLPGYYSALFSLSFLCFANGKGFLSKFLSLNCFDILAKYTFDFYMIHELTLRIFRKVFVNVETNYLLKITVIAVPSFIVSCFFIFTYRYLVKKLHRKVIA